MFLVKEYIRRFIKGIPIGIFLGQVFLTISACIFKYKINWNYILIQNIVASLLGGYYYGNSIIYKIEEWSPLKQTIIYWLTFPLFFPIAWFMGWIPENIYLAIIFTILYSILIFIFWFYHKKKYTSYVNELNENLKNWHK